MSISKRIRSELGIDADLDSIKTILAKDRKRKKPAKRRYRFLSISKRIRSELGIDADLRFDQNDLG